MSLKIGIVGLPNVGKSTIFKALTKKQVNIENYPFCTIEPNIGTVGVPDKRLKAIASVAKSQNIIYNTVEFVDIAGIVKGAHSGKGLGNKFLSHIREVDVIIEVLRDFKDESIFHTEGSVDPLRDKDIIDIEMIYADIEMIEKINKKLEKDVRSMNKEVKFKVDTLCKIKKWLEEENRIINLNLSEEEVVAIKEYNFLTAKPVIYVKNTSEEDNAHEDDFIKINANKEVLISETPEDESGLDRLIKRSYKMLNLISFFTAGEKEARAWSLENGLTAPFAAKTIHTDFLKGFIRAEVVKFDDFMLYEGWIKAKEKGVVKDRGKDYIVNDGDILYFKVA